MVASKKVPNSIDVEVGSRVHRRRIQLGISLTKLGEAVGVSFQQIQKYESGVNRVSASRLQQFSDILQVPVSFFFDGVHPSATKNAKAVVIDEVADFLATPEARALVKAFMRLKSANLRRRAVRVVQEIVTKN